MKSRGQLPVALQLVFGLLPYEVTRFQKDFLQNIEGGNQV